MAAATVAANRMNVVAVVLVIMVMLQSVSVFAADKKKAKAGCYDIKYPKCYGYHYECPDKCPYSCEMDCKTCKPQCSCDKPGGVCQDPRFIGGDGITFYFHGQKEKDFCLVSDSELHINGHFIGKRADGMGRDFTWVQSIGVLFGSDQLYLGAEKVGTWDDAHDHLAMSLNGKPLMLPAAQGATLSVGDLTITRFDAKNAVTVGAEDKFQITARVVPITEDESRIHKYGITSDDCLAHLELSFKFFSLSPHVTGVLGQTYGAEYRSPIKVGPNNAMPVMGGAPTYLTSNLFSTDCKVSRFGLEEKKEETKNFSILDVNCSGGQGGRGMVCRK